MRPFSRGKLFSEVLVKLDFFIEVRIFFIVGIRRSWRVGDGRDGNDAAGFSVGSTLARTEVSSALTTPLMV